MTRLIVGLCLAGLLFCAYASAQEQSIPENLYQGELVAFPGPWAFQVPRSHIILVSDDQLEGLTNPDNPVDIGMTGTPQVTTLRDLCKSAQAAGRRTLVFAFDHFFSQYRKGQGDKPRAWMPDTDGYIERVAAISKTAQEYGLGLELSLLSPLEIGRGYEARTGESGRWMQYRKGLRDSESGTFDVQLWRHRRWSNNKGPIDIADAGVRVFAFSEQAISRTQYRVVDPGAMVEITDGVSVEVWEGMKKRAGDFEAVRMRVSGAGGPKGLDRVLVVQQYRTPEMDYFSDKALPFLQNLVDRYLDAGIKLNGLYSDEMHIQQDWNYFNHHDAGAFALRYVSPGLEQRFAALYGAQYADLARYMVYFAYGQEDFAADLSAKQDVMHVFGNSPEAVRETALFRARYYHLLQDGVVDLFTAAKHYAESRIGYRLESRAHATWAESPTIDSWSTGTSPLARHQYEYTSDFVWSNTVQQAASACHDYFKWGDFLTGNGNDHAEGGWLDRNYYALALGCSTGVINEVPYSYAAHWGMPDEISRRRMALVNAFGAAAVPAYGLVQGMEHRDVNVLMLYPLDLVAVDERFGSWTTQYGYANYITQAKLLELGRVENGAIHLAGRRFDTLATQFEPFPSVALLDMMAALAEQGGRVIWSGPPPLLTREGANAAPRWQELLGVDWTPGIEEGRRAPGEEVRFEGVLEAVPPQMILTGFTVDRVSPVTPRAGTEIVARVKGDVAGTRRMTPAGGQFVYLGFRPRDDQAASLGYEMRTWFATLDRLGAYAATGRFAENDNPERLSRTTPYLCCRFPNGTVAIAPHLRDLEEGWPGGFVRKPEEDARALEGRQLPSEALELADFAVAGHRVSYTGSQCVTFRVDDAGNLLGFAGAGAREITVDGKATAYADAPMPFVAWGPVEPNRRVPGGAVLQMQVHGTGTVRVPAFGLPEPLQFFREGAQPGSRGAAVTARKEGEQWLVDIDASVSGPWIYAVPG